MDVNSYQSVLYVASHGMEDSYRATLIFAAAKKVKEDWPQIDVKVALLGEAIWLANKNIENNFSLGPPKDLAGNEVRPQLSSLIEECGRRGVAIGV